jgi:DNA-binding GntR family transcriptional regulator
MNAGSYTGVDPGRRSEVAYARLKTKLLVGEFSLNQRLGEERLASELEVSRTPVREALQRLAAEGLVVRHPEGGWQPSAPDVQRTRDLYEARQALELAAMRRPSESGQRHDPSVLEPLRDHWRSLAREEPTPDPEFVLQDEGFHIRLAESGGNQAMVELLGFINERIRVVRMHDFLTAERVSRTIAQHLSIVEALLATDLHVAELRFVHHLGESMAIVEERVMRALARMASSRPKEGQ